MIVVNCSQIDYIEQIPETKIIMMNKETHIVRESLDEVIEKTVAYYASIQNSDRFTDRQREELSHGCN